MPEITVTVDRVDGKGVKGNPIANPVEVAELREKGLTFPQIGKLLGCSKQAAHRAYKNLKTEFRGLEKFKDIRADVFALFQKKMLYSLTADDIKGMAPDRRIWSAAVLYDKERLERDKSTANVAYQAIVQDVADLEAEEQRIRAQIAEITGGDGSQAVTPD